MNPFISLLTIDNETVKVNINNLLHFRQIGDETYLMFTGGEKLIVRDPAKSISRLIEGLYKI